MKEGNEIIPKQNKRKRNQDTVNHVSMLQKLMQDFR